MTSPRRALVVLGAMLASRGALAEPLAAITPAPDPWQAELVGPSGQLWLPDGAGAWELRGAGGAAADVTGAVRADGSVVTGKAAPFYRHVAESWHAVRLGERGKTVAGTGPRAAIAIGRQIYVWNGQRWLRAATAPGPVVALWAASDTKLYVAGTTDVWRLQGKRLVPHATVSLRAFADGATPTPWAITADGALYDPVRKTTTPVALGGSAATVAHVAEADGVAWLLARRADAWVVARLDRTGWTEIAGPGLAPTDEIAGFAVAAGRGPMIVTRAGQVWLRAADVWRPGALRVQAVSPRPGPGPARSPG